MGGTVGGGKTSARAYPFKMLWVQLKAEEYIKHDIATPSYCYTTTLLHHCINIFVLQRICIRLLYCYTVMFLYLIL